MEKTVRKLGTTDYMVENENGVRYCAFLVAEDKDFCLGKKMKKDKGEDLKQDLFYTKVTIWKGQTKSSDVCQLFNCKECKKFEDYESRFSEAETSLLSVI